MRVEVYNANKKDFEFWSFGHVYVPTHDPHLKQLCHKLQVYGKVKHP